MTKVALVTGAGSGVGRAVALRLAKDGYAIILCGRRSGPIDEVAREAGPQSMALAADVANPESVQALFAQVARKFGRLDLLFNNAGVATPATPLEDLTLEDWHKVVDINLTGVFLCTQAAFRLMKSQLPRGGRIINNGSISATAPRPLMIAYTATKHAVTGLTKSTSLEGRPYDIACGQIDVGNTVTPLAGPLMTQGTLQADMSLKPEPLFDVEHVANAVGYMASLPLDANVLFMTVMATKMPFVGRG